VHFYGTRHKPNFGEKSEAGKSVAIVSARQHRPEGQNPIALTASRRNAAQAWLRLSLIRKSGHRFLERSCSIQKNRHDRKKWAPVFEKIMLHQKSRANNRFDLKHSRSRLRCPDLKKLSD
jgi:hypothetical protein